MDAAAKIIEMEGTVNKEHHLVLDKPDLPIEGPKRVKVIIQVEETEKEHPIKKLYGAMKDSKIDGMAFQKEARGEW